MKVKWKEAPLRDKIVTIVSVAASLSVVVLAVLQILDIWKQANNLSIPLMGVVMLCQAYIQWQVSRKVACFSMGAAVFIFLCAIIVFFV